MVKKKDVQFLNCGYTGKDFFIVSEKEHKKILKEKFHKK